MLHGLFAAEIPLALPPPAPRISGVPGCSCCSALAAVSVVALGVTLFSRKVASRTTGRPERIDSLLVLPLKNLSGDPEQDYFADGMTDALNARLAGVSALRVISQTSSLFYRGTHKPLPKSHVS